WTLLQATRAAVPDAYVALHLREFVWRRDPGVPRLTRLTLVVTKKVGPLLLRREYLASNDETHTSPSISHERESASTERRVRFRPPRVHSGPPPSNPPPTWTCR